MVLSAADSSMDIDRVYQSLIPAPTRADRIRDCDNAGLRIAWLALLLVNTLLSRITKTSFRN
jgi:hypothetical protein